MLSATNFVWHQIRHLLPGFSRVEKHNPSYNKQTLVYSDFESSGTCQAQQISFGINSGIYCQGLAGLKSTTRTTENNRRPDSNESGRKCQVKQILFSNKFSSYCRGLARLKSATRPTKNDSVLESGNRC